MREGEPRKKEPPPRMKPNLKLNVKPMSNTGPFWASEIKPEVGLEREKDLSPILKPRF